MYRNALDGLISAKNVPNFILLRGVDEFQLELYTQKLIKYFASENFLSFYYDEYDYILAKGFFEPSLFGGSNMLYIKSTKSLNKKEAENLINECKKNQNNRLIFELNEENGTANRDFLACFDKNDVRFFRPNSIDEAILLLSKKCEMCEIFPNSAALRKIYQKHNENLYLSAAEIEKFANLGAILNIENVELLVSGLSEVSFDELFDKIFSGVKFYAEFETYTKSSNYNEIEFLNYLYRTIFRIFSLHAFAKISGRFDFKTVLGYEPPQNVKNQIERLAKGISTKKFLQIFQFINLLEFNLKTKKNLEKEYYLLSKLMELQRILIKK